MLRVNPTFGREMEHRRADDIPSELFKHLTAPQNTENAVNAMRLFLREADEEQFEFAVAVYVASARLRDEPIQTVMSALCTIASDLEGPSIGDGFSLKPTRLHQLIFAGILRAFYGDAVVERAIGASAQRKADAPQHTKAGTWPNKPVN